MRTARLIAACIAGALVLVAVPSWAQSTPAETPECAETDTLKECWDSIVGTAAGVVAEKAAAEAAPEVAEKSTGVASGATGLASTTEDFLPLLTFVGLVSESDSASSDGVLAFDVNPPFGAAKSPGLKLRLLVETAPTVGEDVKMVLPEAARDEQAATLQKSLSDTDNYALSLTWNLQKPGFGRSFERYRDDFAKLAKAAQESLAAQAALAANREMGQVIQQALASSPGFDLTKPFQQDALTPGQQLALRRSVEAAAAAILLKDEARTQALQDAGLGKFAALVANQPQLHFAAKWQSRDPLTGGDEVSAKATFEWSKVNLKNALKDASCDRAAPFSADCADAYRRYVEEHAANMETAARFSFSGEYVDVDSRTLDLTSLDLGSVTLPGAKKLVLSAAGSRNWGKGGIGEPIRVDFQASYEDVSDDPMRQNRGIATLTLNKKIAGMSIPLGITYANRPEFITDVDDRLSTHLGLKFDFLPKTDG